MKQTQFLRKSLAFIGALLVVSCICLFGQNAPLSNNAPATGAQDPAQTDVNSSAFWQDLYNKAGSSEKQVSLLEYVNSLGAKSAQAFYPQALSRLAGSWLSANGVVTTENHFRDIQAVLLMNNITPTPRSSQALAQIGKTILNQTSNPDVKMAALGLIGRTSDKDSLSTLTLKLRQAIAGGGSVGISSNVIVAYIDAIAAYNDPKTVPLLIETALSKYSTRAKTVAWRAVHQLSPDPTPVVLSILIDSDVPLQTVALLVEHYSSAPAPYKEQVALAALRRYKSESVLGAGKPITDKQYLENILNAAFKIYSSLQTITPESVTELAKTLKDDTLSLNTRINAVNALGKKGSEGSDQSAQVLSSVLTSLNQKAQLDIADTPTTIIAEAIINVLGAIKNPTALSPLMEVMTSNLYGPTAVQDSKQAIAAINPNLPGVSNNQIAAAPAPAPNPMGAAG